MAAGDDRIRDLLAELAAPAPARAWREFLETYAPVLQQVVHLIETDTDAAADCFLYICEQLAHGEFRRLRRFDVQGPASFTTWLRAVARNLSIDWFRKVHGRARDGLYPVQPKFEPLAAEESLRGGLLDPRPDPEMLAADGERDSELRRLVARLDKPEQLLVRLRFEQDLTLDQIARLTGLKDAQTVDRRLRQILQGMRERLPPGGGKFRARSV